MEKVRKYKDVIISVVLVALSAYVYFTARGFSRGADVFPKFLSLVIAIFALLLSAQTLIKIHKKRLSTSRESANEATEEPVSIWIKLRPLSSFILVIIYIFCIPRLGFFVSTTIFVILQFIVLRVRSVWYYVGSIAGLVIGIYALFVFQLNVPVPRGILF